MIRRQRCLWRMLAVLLVSVCLREATAQTVSPAVVQYTGAAEGSFEIANDGLVPLVATIEPRSFSIDTEGTAAFSSLSAGTHVELSQTSVRIPPKQRRTIYYKASATSYPAWFTVYSNITGLPRRDGMNVVLSLPHTVYLLSKRPVQQSSVRLSDVRQSGTTLEAVVENNSAEVVRVLEVEGVHGRSAARAGGFPLLPQGRRTVRIEVPFDARVTRLKLRTATMIVEQAVP